ncbi:hypothetical protein OC834_006885 [Tilletia horrida]|uniref:Phosphatidylserine decarboxylase n=1 Tax=Tilletia horrida TaxID=155126 RepID=A0AAN6G757_9BASI|nr:hypothetical protein OC834_006885 [Tilletia horrida]KAK0520849.1 hypothetical protein OC842_006970 [Tilletia horrida]KAK0522205.1 hypothetical protein OC835_006655 [Tilletia horrida]KAK0549274.1 hypothetical protein OC844_006887 [Tilletia horrida]
MSSQPTDPQHQPKPEEQQAIAAALDHLVAQSSGEKEDTLAPQWPSESAVHPAKDALKTKHKWFKRFYPKELYEDVEERMDALFAEHHLGNYVAIRNSNPPEKIFESQPIYVRLGMHLLFHRNTKSSLLKYESVEDMLEKLSIKQGKAYDDTSDPAAVREHIEEFIKTYEISLHELLNPDIASYSCMNAFFTRKLRPDARPIAEPENNKVISSAADCRLTVWSNVDAATKFWIKDHLFTIAHVLDDQSLADTTFAPGSSLAIFRLAPADYHRWHNPVGPAVVGPIKHVKGEYLTVNPQAVNADFQVFTRNRRDTGLLNWSPTGPGGETHTVAMVAVGAMLVGSINWTDFTQGRTVQRGDEQGFFAYGGSTCIAIFPPSARVEWDADLLKNSQDGVETMVRVGERIGISTA